GGRGGDAPLVRLCDVGRRGSARAAAGGRGGDAGSVPPRLGASGGGHRAGPDLRDRPGHPPRSAGAGKDGLRASLRAADAARLGPHPRRGTGVSDPGLEALVSLRHPGPHQLLGAHADGDGTRVRAFRPEAESITLQADDGRSWPMQPLGRGLFEVRVPGTLGPYHFQVHYPGGPTFTLGDPYRFWPTLGEQDTYFLNTGRHERPWEKLGAHPMLHGGTAGTAFAVWAPAAAGVSVVGDFKGWAGRLHPMRRMGSSGVWELFVPELGEGARYKFEIRPRGGGPPFLKADPFAFRTEGPPATASVVHPLDRYR